jgi:hypothetical protein
MGAIRALSKFLSAGADFPLSANLGFSARAAQNLSDWFGELWQ